MSTAGCTHSFPDPHPDPIEQIGNCRGCGISYQEAKAAMTTVEELRAAARTLRALLADPQLTPGPWLSMDRGDRLLWNGEGAEDQAPVYVVDEPMSNGANADYIAVMHPDVGHALARVFDAWARIGELDPDLLNRVGGHETLALARLINTGSQP